MNNALPMGAIARARNLNGVLEGRLDRQRSSREARGQRLTAEELHDDEVQVVLTANVIQPADVDV